MGAYSGADGAVRLGGDQDGRHDQEQPGPRPLRSRSRSHRQVRYDFFGYNIVTNKGKKDRLRNFSETLKNYVLRITALASIYMPDVIKI